MSSDEPSRFPEMMSVLQTAVPAPSRLNERRLHARHTSARLKFTFLGAEHEPTSWSLGGFLVADSHPHTTLGIETAGFLAVLGRPGRYAMHIQLVRRDERTHEIAFRFIEPSPGLLDALTRAACDTNYSA